VKIILVVMDIKYEPTYRRMMERF